MEWFTVYPRFIVYSLFFHYFKESVLSVMLIPSIIVYALCDALHRVVFLKFRSYFLLDCALEPVSIDAHVFGVASTTYQAFILTLLSPALSQVCSVLSELL